MHMHITMCVCVYAYIAVITYTPGSSNFVDALSGVTPKSIGPRLYVSYRLTLLSYSPPWSLRLSLSLRIASRTKNPEGEKTSAEEIQFRALDLIGH